jgi:precorrin-8X/cobalt-precorrin-8 methylmutase
MGNTIKTAPHIIPPREIEERSFAIIESEVPDPKPFAGEEWLIARRLIHTSADFDLLRNLCFHPRAVQAGVDALKRGGFIVTDTEMARVGMTRRRLESLGSTVECYINHPDVVASAEREGSTRSAAAVDHAVARITGAIVAVGNAPTALLRLLQRMEKGDCRPALIVGMPVGFVNAEESKELLILQKETPYITIRGRKGGSNLAAAVINQLAEIALEKK